MTDCDSISPHKRNSIIMNTFFLALSAVSGPIAGILVYMLITVPVALWVIKKSSSFEDAIRKAVSLGADADTLSAIVGSIAEAIWGIPESIKRSIMDYLPDEMIDVVNEFSKCYE